MADGEEEVEGTAICTPDDKSPGMLSTNGLPAFSFSQSNNGIPKQWIQLDIQSTIDLLCNPELLTNDHELPTSMAVNCNADLWITNLLVISADIRLSGLIHLGLPTF